MKRSSSSRELLGLPSTSAFVLAAVVVLLEGFASAQLLPLVDLAAPPGSESARVLRVYGDDAGDRLGSELSEAIAFGDLNGDGYADLAVGAERAGGSTGNLRAGEVYVIYGSPESPLPVLDLNTDGAVSPAGETRLLGDGGESAEDPSGETDLGGVLAVGDVDGDGYDDLVVTARLANPSGRSWAGTVFVVFGGPALPGTVVGFHTDGVASQFGETRVLGAGTFDHTGTTAAACGDVDGDGYDDVVFQTRRNRAYVLYGSPALRGVVVDLATPGASSAVFTTMLGAGGDPVDGLVFRSVATADVDGDGRQDILVGSPYADPEGRTDAGAAYVVYGSPALRGATLDLWNPAGSDVTVLLGAAPGDQAGASVAGGDVDGDGVRDVVVGVPSADGEGRTDAGAACVVYGGPGLRGLTVDFQNPPGPGETRIVGDDGKEQNYGSVGDWAGSAVGTADANGDGVDDVVIGAPRAYGATASLDSVGEVVVVYGAPGLRGTTIDLAAGAAETRIRAAARNQRLGLRVAKGRGDLDGDGNDEVVARVNMDNPSIPANPDEAGAIVVVFGDGAVTNEAPVAFAGENLQIASCEQVATALAGVVSDAEGDALEYADGQPGAERDAPVAPQPRTAPGDGRRQRLRQRRGRRAPRRDGGEQRAAGCSGRRVDGPRLLRGLGGRGFRGRVPAPSRRAGGQRRRAHLHCHHPRRGRLREQLGGGGDHPGTSRPEEEDAAPASVLPADPLVERAGPGEVGDQELHLVRQDPAALEVHVLGVGGSEGHRQELHPRLLGGSARLVVVAALARGDDVVPAVDASVAQGRHVVPGEEEGVLALAAVQAQVRVAAKEDGIAEGRGVAPACLREDVPVTRRGEDGVDLDGAPQAGPGRDPAAQPVQDRPEGVDDAVEMVQAHGLLVADPLQGHAGHVDPEHLLFQAVQGASRQRRPGFRTPAPL